MITIEEFHDVTQRCGCLVAIDSKELARALQHFHNSGTVLHIHPLKTRSGLLFCPPTGLLRFCRTFSLLIPTSL